MTANKYNFISDLISQVSIILNFCPNIKLQLQAISNGKFRYIVIWKQFVLFQLFLLMWDWIRESDSVQAFNRPTIQTLSVLVVCSDNVTFNNSPVTILG